MSGRIVEVADEAAMVQTGRSFGGFLSGGAVVYLYGMLGAGKTTFCRGVLRSFGHSGAVKSPTYTLVEPYEMETTVYHFDLYRLADPEELEYMGIRDYFLADKVCLVEWPEKGTGVIPDPDVELMIENNQSGRKLTFRARTRRGETILENWGSN